ncbi:multinuclear nonheme iron-dependent oxidase [Planktothrix agardhii]|nr:DUF692 family multinuclear iron-containing protein [Planktothrix agardhii]
MTIELSLSVNNLTDFSIYEEASQPIRNNGKLPFVEILWDNYCHLAPDKIVEYLSTFSDCIAFHIMWSRFLDRDSEQFEEFLHHLKSHIDVIQPLYISDHICTFHQGNVYVKSGLEFNYENPEYVWRRIERYQNYIGRQILLENFASMTSEGYKQIEFFETMVTQTGCGIFFDISNARVAEYNGFTPLIDWIDLLKGMPELHCHVGGYEYNDNDNYYRDSHGDDISSQTLLDIENVVSSLDVKSICYEREHHKISHKMAQDLAKIASIGGEIK